MLDVPTFQGLRSALPDDRFHEIVRLFRETGQNYLADMESALAAGRMEDLDRAAHTLKSSAAVMGAVGLSRLCKDIEATAREHGPPPHEQLLRARAEFEGALARIDAALL